jgi:hypothetical protein
LPLHVRAAAAAVEAVAAACAALNLLFFAVRVASSEQRRSHRAASAAMALVSLGALLEGLAFSMTPPQSEAVVWTVLRLPALLGTMGVTMLVLRRLAAG